eukprot:CAMPEP_0119341974 /NCGR_PEP_ID=MMETSP1333-20130426/103741_1 /TAXON_ID=418940 /ORGANISM="Scyphosphaera apsteinii, Strain RCC1455" /LENGTH=148 /DNA_ID=CAMNT_0007354085 /DNA_START=165 /DNA_END=612 /DNA_ORIENTATION=+
MTCGAPLGATSNRRHAITLIGLSFVDGNLAEEHDSHAVHAWCKQFLNRLSPHQDGQILCIFDMTCDKGSEGKHTRDAWWHMAERAVVSSAASWPFASCKPLAEQPNCFMPPPLPCGLSMTVVEPVGLCGPPGINWIFWSHVRGYKDGK